MDLPPLLQEVGMQTEVVVVVSHFRLLQACLLTRSPQDTG